MARVLTSAADAPTGATIGPGESKLQKRADICLLAGCLLGGSFILGPLGLPFVIYGFVLLKRAQKQGEQIRPWVYTIMAVFCMVDAGINYSGWGSDLFWSHDTPLIATLWTGFGRTFDMAYYLHYNTTPTGGVANVGEKSYEMMCVLMVFPMRFAAAWGFMKMKRWGLQFMVITSWIYVAVWVGYYSHIALDFENRMVNTAFGVTGYWLISIPFITPFVLIPYLHTLNREMFSE
jgi:hypothetical protein